ncbi:hypothetical protein [Salinimicrobium soli]
MRKLLFFLFLSLQVAAQEYTVKKGLVVDSLKVSDSLSETYALYLPTNFQPDKKWPVLFLFDGKGRGRATAQLFKNAAEEQGYLLVSSNAVSEEQPLKENLEVASRLVLGTAGALPFDLNQISAAGSNEGGRVASTVPVLFKNILGVIAVGNEWIKFDLLDKKKDFCFIGVTGDENFASAGIYYTARQLGAQKYPVEVYTYEGGGDWPESEIISSVVGSLTLEAMKKELRLVDQQLIDKLFEEDLSRVDKLMSNVKLLKAHELLETMLDKYKDLHDLSRVEERLNSLRKSRNYISQKREYEDVVEKEMRLMDDFSYYMEDDILTRNLENLGWWNYQKIRLDSISKVGGAEGKMAERLKGFVAEVANSFRDEMEKQKGYSVDSKMIANLIATIYNPHNYEAYKDIITLSAQDNDFPTALFYLEEMLKNGYKDMDELYEIPGTLGLKLTPEYNELIRKYLGDSRYYD